MLTPLQMVHEFLSDISHDAVVVDATMGQGYDTVFLAKLSNHVFAFDVQEVALVTTRQRLSDNELTAELILDGHENLDLYIKQPVDSAIFNLGYLPQSDKSIITHGQTTLAALTKLLALLVRGGRIGMMVYYGHDGGVEERDEVLAYVMALPQNAYHVMRYGGINQAHQPPFALLIEKR